MNALFIAAMAVEALFGLGFILAPGALLNPMGVTLDGVSDALARLFGTAIFSLAVLVWLARKSDSTPFKRGTVITLFTYYLLSGGLFVIILLSGLMNAMGWSTVILHLGLAAWCGAILVAKRG
jgi:hypothetical protein